MEDIENGMLIKDLDKSKLQVATCEYCEEPIFENEEYIDFLGMNFHEEHLKSWLEEKIIRK